MGDEVMVHITLPVDDQGMIGRQCPSCDHYFKLKFGTGVQSTTTTACPYCEHKSDSSNFTTNDQTEYAKSVAVNQTLGPLLGKLQRSLKELERKSKGSLIQIKAIGTDIRFPIKYYEENDLETRVECDHCGLIFAVYGVFASCPDCSRLNSMSIFRSSLEAVRKRLSIIGNIPHSETELRQGLVADSISAGVATFDSLGKRLRKEFPEVIPSHPRNLFQNLEALSQALWDGLGFEVAKYLGGTRLNQFMYMFQVRHLWIHNFGEADKEFVQKTGCDQSIIGSKIAPSEEEVLSFLATIEQLGVEIRSRLSDAS